MTSSMPPLTSSLSSSVTDLSKPAAVDSEKQLDVSIDKEMQPDAPTGNASDGSLHDKEVEVEEDGGPLALDLSRIDTADYPNKFPLAMIVVALCLAVFMMSLDMTIVATAIPKITDQFHSLDQVGWYGSAFFLTVAAFQSTWGKAYKYFPLKLTSYVISSFYSYAV